MSAAREPFLPPSLVALLGVVFVNLVGFGVVVPLLPFFARSLGAPGWQITIMFSAFSLGQFFGEQFWGRLSDRIGRRRVLMVSTAGNALGYLLLAFAPNIWLAILARLFGGFMGGNISTVQGYIADVTPPAQRAGRMGLVGAAFGLGFIVGPALGGLLVREELGHIGFQIPLFVGAALAATAALGVRLLVLESLVKSSSAPPSPLKAFGEAVAHPVISRVLLVSLVYMAGFSGMEATFGLWAAARFEWGAREVGLCFVVIGLVSTIAQAGVTGRLARRFGEAKVLACGMSMLGLSLVAQTQAPAGWLVPIFMAFGSFGMALAMPCIAALISRSSPPDRQGGMLGLNMAAGSGARIVGPLIAGFAFTYLGHNWPFLIGAALVLPAVIIALNAGRVLREQRQAGQLAS